MDSHLSVSLRREYPSQGFSEADAGDDPITLFDTWLAEAVAAQIPEPHAMALATADLGGRPSVRLVLLKSLDADGATFVSNYESRKGQELAANPSVSGVLLWHPIFRQVRIEGRASILDDAESDVLFAQRPRGAQIAAAASMQSHVIASRPALEDQFSRIEAALGDAPVARPHNWGGYRIEIERMEFWQGQPNRLHDRLLFTRDSDDSWTVERLQP